MPRPRGRTGRRIDLYLSNDHIEWLKTQTNKSDVVDEAIEHFRRRKK